MTVNNARIQKAYKDYLYTRNMMETDGDAGLADLASTSLRFLKQHGRLDKLEETGESGGYAVKINVNVGGENEPWLLMHGNNGSLEGAFRWALLQKTVPFAVMRVSGGESPLNNAAGIDGDLSPREAVVRTAERFSDYVVRAGVPVGAAAELYHPAFSKSRMDVAFTVSATPAVNMRRGDSAPDDLLMIIEDADEGNDTSSSAGFFRKINRLFSLGDAKRMIKDISPAENGGFVFRLGSEYAEVFEYAAKSEGLRCIAYEELSAEPSEAATDMSNVNADNFSKQANLKTSDEKKCDWKAGYITAPDKEIGFSEGMRRVAEDLNTCSARGLSERFDSSIGGGTVFMPLGGKNQLSPMQAMVNKIPASGATEDCIVAAWGGNPFISEESPYDAAYLAIVESVSKLVATGASFNEIYLSLYGRFGSKERAKAALLGAFEAEMGLAVPAISGSQEISEDDLSDTVISFATTTGIASELISPEFKAPEHKVVMLTPKIEEDEESVYYGLPTPNSLVDLWRKAYELIVNGKAVAAYAPGIGGVAEAIMKMSYGNGIGFEFNSSDIDWGDDAKVKALSNKEIFAYSYGSIILEMRTADSIKSRSVIIKEIGRTTDRQHISRDEEALSIGELMTLYEGKLEAVFPSHKDSGITEIGNLAYSARSWHTPIFKRSAPKFLIPVVSACTGDYDVVRAVRAAGGKPEVLLLKTSNNEETEKSAAALAEAIENTQVIILPDGYAGGSVDPAEIITYLFRHEAVRSSLSRFLDKKDGLMAGIGEGFKALVDLGLLPFGEITDEDGASLGDGPLGASHSRIVRLRVASNKSPWLRSNKPGEIRMIPVSGAGGRFSASDALMNKLAVNGQIACQYVDADGNASADIRYNPSASALAIEAVTSPDGRIIGRMGHAERVASGLYRNIPGEYLNDMFENAVRYFK